LFYVWMIMGMELFNGGGDPNRCQYVGQLNALPDATFCGPGATIFALLQIITTNDWPDLMYNTMEKYGDWASIYFVVFFLTGPIIMISLLIGYVLDFYFEKINKEFNEGHIHNEHGTTRMSYIADEPSLTYSLQQDDSEDAEQGQVLQGLVANLREDLNYLKRRIRDRLRDEKWAKGKDRMGAPDHMGNTNMGRSGTLQQGDLHPRNSTYNRSSTKLPHHSSTEFFGGGGDRARSSTTALGSSAGFGSKPVMPTRDKIKSLPPRHQSLPPRQMPPIKQGSAIEMPATRPSFGSGSIGIRGKSSAL